MQGQAPVWMPWVSLEVSGMKKGPWANLQMQKYFCMSCVNCENFKTDPFTGKTKCLREEKAGSWKKGVFKEKNAKDSKD